MPDQGGQIRPRVSEDARLASLLSVVDVLLLLAVFGVFTVITAPLGDTGLFPLVFLVAGIAFLTIELVTQLLPGRYSTIARDVLNRDIGTVEIPDDEGSSTMTIPEPERSLPRVLYIVLAMLLLFVVTYTVNFFVAMLAFSLVTGWVFGLRDYRLLVVTLLLAATVYGIFGEIINTPIFE